MASIKYQMRAISRAKPTNPNVSPLLALMMERPDVAKRARQYRRWIAASA